MTTERTPPRDIRQRLARLASAADPPPSSEAGQDWLLMPVPGDPVGGPAVDLTGDAAPAPSWWRRGRSARLIERWTPPEPVGQHRLAPDHDPPRRWPRTVLVGVGVVAVVVGVTLAVSAPAARPEPAPNLPAAVVDAVDTGAARPSVSTESIVVNVVGKVARPGLVTLTTGARVADAVRAAGEVLPGTDTTGLNLARRLADGEQVFVGVVAPPGAAPQADGGEGGPVDLNTATLSELDTLPGVGEVTAKRIVDWRTKHGRFGSVDQLREIDGIGPARFASLRDLVVVR